MSTDPIRYIDTVLATDAVAEGTSEFEQFVVAAVRARGVAASDEVDEARARWFRVDPSAVLRSFALEELLARKIALYLYGATVTNGEEMIRRAVASYHATAAAAETR